MDIKKFVEKYKKKISKREGDIEDFKESHNPELLNVIPVYEREIDEYRTMIDALEKQMPQKPAFAGGRFGCKCGWDIYRDKQPYCFMCGQKLKWD